MNSQRWELKDTGLRMHPNGEWVRYEDAKEECNKIRQQVAERVSHRISEAVEAAVKPLKGEVARLAENCPECKGEGIVEFVTKGDGSKEFESEFQVGPCLHCDGTGKNVVRLLIDANAMYRDRADSATERNLQLIQRCEAEEKRVAEKDAEISRLKAEVVHCDSCGGSWVDDGINGGCTCAEIVRLRDQIARLEEEIKGHESVADMNKRNWVLRSTALHEQIARLEARRAEACKRCSGSGMLIVERKGDRRCPYCHGTGAVIVDEKGV